MNIFEHRSRCHATPRYRQMPSAVGLPQSSQARHQFLLPPRPASWQPAVAGSPNHFLGLSPRGAGGGGATRRGVSWRDAPGINSAPAASRHATPHPSMCPSRTPPRTRLSRDTVLGPAACLEYQWRRSMGNASPHRATPVPAPPRTATPRRSPSLPGPSSYGVRGLMSSPGIVDVVEKSFDNKRSAAPRLCLPRPHSVAPFTYCFSSSGRQ